MMVSLPPLDLKTMRCAEPSDEMSIVSSPASPSMVMVLRRRLVPEKSPTISKVSPPGAAVGPAGSTPLMRISSISRELGDDDRALVAVAGDDDLGGRGEAGPERCRQRPAQAARRVDAVGLGRGVAVDHEGVAGGAFGSAVDEVAAVGRSRRIGVPDDRVVAGIAVDGVDAGVGAGRRDVDHSCRCRTFSPASKLAVRRGTGSPNERRSSGGREVAVAGAVSAKRAE